MFELSVAAKYLTPRWRQLSVSIISMISILVIAMVVWLIVVFFSVTNGLTNSWIEKLIGLTAPVRITPTDAYYNSYYYQVDGISTESEYTLKTIGEKLQAGAADPYNPTLDEEVPSFWPLPHLDVQGALLDPVKEAFSIIQAHNHIGSDYELTMATLKIRLLRSTSQMQKAQGFLNQSTYLGSLDPTNPMMARAIIPYSAADIGNILKMSTVAADRIQDDVPDRVFKADPENIKERLRTFFSYASIKALKAPPAGTRFPHAILPNSVPLTVAAAYRQDTLVKVVLPINKRDIIDPGSDLVYKTATLTKNGSQMELHVQGQSAEVLPERTPIFLAGGTVLEAEIIPDSISAVMDPSHLRFHIHFLLQGHHVAGDMAMGNLEVAKATLKTEFDEQPQTSPFWLYSVEGKYVLPSSAEMGEGVLLPKSFRDAGAFIGDAGTLSYYSPTISSVQEQRTPVYVAGFYDPGILPMGGKFVLANGALTSLVRSSQGSAEALVSNGINVRFDNWEDAELVKERLQEAFERAGIAPYWKIETFREFEFTRDILKQLNSEKRLFSMLATIIIIVACSNIVSMLIILVNDKKLEIGILRSMGASSVSIAMIFGICGIVMGLAGGLIGTVAAFLTLKNLQAIVDFISRVQGFEMFNPVFYGDTLPTDISLEAFLFVMVSTVVISLVSGLVPAVKACLMRPSAILKAE